MNHSRESARQDFLNYCHISGAKIEPLAQDASFRQYFRIHDRSHTYVLMDAPPSKELIEPFINIAQHLSNLNLRAPEILYFDLQQGLILMEDFGDNTFTRLLAKGHDEDELYDLALDTLIGLHKNPDAKRIQLPDYSHTLLIDEALLLPDWYYRYCKSSTISEIDRENYILCWQSILSELPAAEQTLVLRDYHVDNLIKLHDGKCGLLDFQDAVIGSAAYDLASLLEDARRDVKTELKQRLLKRYLDEFTNIETENFMHWYAVLAAQRHCKVLGIFTRLSVRDKKHQYLDHLMRVSALLRSHLHNRDLEPLKLWLTDNQLWR